MTRDTAFLADIHKTSLYPQEVSLVTFTLQLSSFTRRQFQRRLNEAYASGSLKWVKRIHALLALTQSQSVRQVAERLALGEQTVRDYPNQFLIKGMASLVYKAPPGRPRKLTKTQRQRLVEWIKASPQVSGYTSGCWHTPMIQDLVWRHLGVEYNPHYLCTLLKTMGFSYQKARVVSDHLNEAKRLEWRQTRWSKMLQQARQQKAFLLFGDEASFAQWGSLSYTWALKGQQPEVPTRGKRKGDKSFGLIDYFCGQCFYPSQTGRLNSES